MIPNEQLEKYADLILTSGINLKDGEGVVLNGTTEALPLCRAITRLAYQRGAKDVVFILNDDEMSLARFRDGQPPVFQHYPEYKANYIKALYDDQYHNIFIISSGPDLYKDVDSSNVSAFQQIASKVIRETGLMAYRMTGRTKWVIAAVPSADWARSVFPKLSEGEAVAALWEQIQRSIRLDQDDPVAAWNEHDAKLKHYLDALNEMNLDRLHYQSSGMDLMLGLARDHLWCGGSWISLSGDPFIPNMPTEEIFTTPDRNRVEGRLLSTKPLSLNGNLIEGLELVFEKGKVIDCKAQKGADIFIKQMNQDEGASFLGEVALVPYASPISLSNVIFNNTLFDENASCHFAIGQSYASAMKNGDQLSQDELKVKGANQSIVHVDFMVGSSDLMITGYDQQGNAHLLFKDGN